jgi:2-oxoglutaroyl-CoA hydrolase
MISILNRAKPEPQPEIRKPLAQRFSTIVPQLLESLDGFRVEIDAEKQNGRRRAGQSALNVITMKQREQLCAIFNELDLDPALRVIVLRGAGKNFSSGGDIAGFMAETPEHLSELARNVAAPERCHKPVIAAIRGYCLGVAFELALACDFRIVTQSALLGFPEQRIGMIPGSGGSARLLHMIGIGRAKDVVMRSRRISGEEAFAWGIAVSVVPDDKLDAAVASLVEKLKVFSPLAQRTAKSVINDAQDATLHAGIELEGQAFGRLRGTHDFAEGVESFKQRRKPKFEGR